MKNIHSFKNFIIESQEQKEYPVVTVQGKQIEVDNNISAPMAFKFASGTIETISSQGWRLPTIEELRVIEKELFDKGKISKPTDEPNNLKFWSSISKDKNTQLVFDFENSATAQSESGSTEYKIRYIKVRDKK